MSKLYVCEEYENMFSAGFRAIKSLDEYKIDICREFADRLKKDLNPQTGNYGVGFNYEKMCQRFDEVLTEMEQRNFYDGF